MGQVSKSIFEKEIKIMNKIEIFKNEKFDELRVIIRNNEPWFVASDVCDSLEINNPSQALTRLDDDEKDIILNDTLGGEQKMLIVSESGLYSLVLGSRKPEARNFKRWITHDVIPAIRKHGGYLTPESIEKTLTDPDFIINLATTLKNEMAARRLAELENAKLKPKAEFADTLLASDDTILVGDLAKVLSNKGYKIGERTLFSYLRDSKILTKNNLPYQRFINDGYFEVAERPVNTSSGIILAFTTKVTPKGQHYIYKRLKKEAV